MKKLTITTLTILLLCNFNLTASTNKQPFEGRPPLHPDTPMTSAWSELSTNGRVIKKDLSLLKTMIANHKIKVQERMNAEQQKRQQATMITAPQNDTLYFFNGKTMTQLELYRICQSYNLETAQYIISLALPITSRSKLAVDTNETGYNSPAFSPSSIATNQLSPANRNL